MIDLSPTYMVKEIFETLQGEGYHAGSQAVFVRFTGCNLWSGIPRTREKDAERNRAVCPLWCDTDFRGGTTMTAKVLAGTIGIASSMARAESRLIVLTGGEPLLQVDQELIDTLLGAHPRSIIAIETNGSVRARFVKRPRVWVTMSPKLSRDRTDPGVEVDEVKVVFPAVNPADWYSYPTRHRFVSPQADPHTGRLTGVELEAARYVQEHPDWRLSLQTHKVLGIP